MIEGETPARMRARGIPAAAYAWHVAPGGVLVVVDLNRDGWNSVTNDTAGVVAALVELRRSGRYHAQRKLERFAG